jgi:hypothetical protein
MSPSIRNQAKLAGVALAAGLAWTAFGAGDAQAQAFNVQEFACPEGSSAEVDVDIRGLGNTNICVVGTVTASVDCACVGGGGNCPRDAQKQTSDITTDTAQELEPQNGRVFTTVSLDFAEPTDDTCEALLSCPSGQRERLIQFTTEPDGAQFRVCTLEGGEACNTVTCTELDAIATAECEPVSEEVFPGRGDNCLALFP